MTSTKDLSGVESSYTLIKVVKISSSYHSSTTILLMILFSF